MTNEIFARTSQVVADRAPRTRTGSGEDFVLNGHGVVYFGNSWHAENRTSSHHVAERLAAVLPVLYVDSPGLRSPQASGRDLRRAWRKIRATLRAPALIRPNLWLCTVPQLPFRRVPGVEWANRAFGRWAVRRAMRVLGDIKPISWFVVPHPGFLAHRLGERLCVYYCIDDYAAHPGVDTELIATRDRELTRRADLVFVAPPALLGAKQAINAHTRFSPHGVDVSLFARAMAPDTMVAAAARGLTHPVVGYFGSIHAWIDLELIEWLARARPQWTFLLVGHAAVNVSRLQALANVVLVGAQPYAELPSWAKAFDVAIIPYRHNRQVENANPLKLREYLATGKPVVSVGHPEINKFSRWIEIAEGREAFLSGIERALGSDSAAAATARMASVADQTWDNRVTEVLGEVSSALARIQP
ncbi:MAG: glycosyltransferase [Pseudomonadota bacterium]|jgi:glycosyltransferase involved in cell wall biosynthesis|nr:glycosyltransferase [Xanthomonadaceae bacterium]MDE2247016.1 glycosyltransferase [Xanthomonadaceae bacterium]MDE3209788.1 glycosyltransferase [Pseudomonadota bacterium]